MTMEKALGAFLLLLTGQIIWAMQRGGPRKEGQVAPSS